jgi:hypothetical protein
MISPRTTVFLSWSAGRQCTNFARGFAIFSIAALLVRPRAHDVLLACCGHWPPRRHAVQPAS